jgi:hypothetical protein
VVTDPAGAVVPNAAITIRNESTGQAYSLSTDSSGSFSRDGLAAGSYTVTAAATGFQTLNVRGAQLGQNLGLTLPAGNISAAVEVTASQINNLPVNGRASQYALMQTAVANNSNYSSGAETTVSEALVSQSGGVKTAASGEEIGDLFEYRIEQPVSVNRDRSALIPIIQTKMEGERVAIYNEGVRQDRPYSGVLLKNATALTLESGSITVLDGDAYAGEALMERLKPKE